MAASTDAEHGRQAGGHGDLVPPEQLIRDTPGAPPITSIGELRSDAFETDEELYAFLGVPDRVAAR